MPLIRPRYSRRHVLYWVQAVAKRIADSKGKIPDIFLLDAALRHDLEKQPDLLDRDKYVRDCRKHWERANNKAIAAKEGESLFVPGAWVTVGKRSRGMMKRLHPIIDVTAWLQQDAESKENFLKTMARRQVYQMQVIKEASVHKDCLTLGDLEAKLRGYVESSDDENIFQFDEDEDDDGIT